MDVINADHYNSLDPHGYCRVVIADNMERFRIPWKRSNLGNEIQEIHIMNDSNLIPPSTTGYFNKHLICKLIDDILEVQKPQPCEAESARRKLFPPSRLNPRKARKTDKNVQTQSPTLLLKCRNKPRETSCRRIKKSYLNEARQNVLSQIANERLANKRRLSSSSSADNAESPESKRVRISVGECPLKVSAVSSNPNGMLHVKTETGVFPIDPRKLSEICKYHDKMVRHQPAKVRTEYEQFKRNLNTEACRLSRRVSKLAGIILEEQHRERTRTNNKIVEESIRSIHYLKSLLDMLLERDENRHFA